MTVKASSADLRISLASKQVLGLAVTRLVPFEPISKTIDMSDYNGEEVALGRKTHQKSPNTSSS